MTDVVTMDPELAATYQLLSVTIARLGGKVAVSRAELTQWQHRRPRTYLAHGELVMENADD